MIDGLRALLARSEITKLGIINGHGANGIVSNIVQGANVDGYAVSLFPFGAERGRTRDDAGLVSNVMPTRTPARLKRPAFPTPLPSWCETASQTQTTAVAPARTSWQRAWAYGASLV
ncbi:hypothetical protein [Streptomyces sp. NPDC059949]|uniref:hypothetical protein n=1 Tax=Streptomyces sp. NPDC059949 TaxID=3347013 RepID=UPI003660075D